ncbi:hypothetical protein B0H17DRAFT_1212957 [Mycena rosella]|uniref:F-box domain-containing protein n=1 Tax=Mycena rosella TaxID=1033263 RepID=A0AAD7G5R6_MYCRO|nr:hypothetical protein B0H17DRAFT_1212957 [Mycena rosella]
MSVTEIQTRIDSLSADIIRQKKVLQNLERTKSAAQRQLNGVLDPVGRLPLEISGEIFIQCLPSRSTPGEQHIPMLFLNICNTWTDIALATPELWISVHVDQPVVNLAGVLDAWLKRAGSHALSISLPPILTGHGIDAVIRRHAHQLQDLTLFHNEANIGLVAAAGPFLCLETLMVLGLPGSDVDPEENTRVTMDLLQVCPNLVECTFDGVFCGFDFDTAPLELSHMRHLKFGISPGHSGEEPLQYIVSPHLETIYLPGGNLASKNIIQFFRRSSPPLRHLTWGFNDLANDWTQAKLLECLSLLPQLTHLEMLVPETGTTSHLVALLASSPYLVPELSSITLQQVYLSTPWYQQLVAAFSLRREKIKSVRIIWPYDGVRRPAKDVWAALRQLVEGGMKIYIGTDKRNYNYMTACSFLLRHSNPILEVYLLLALFLMRAH